MNLSFNASTLTELNQSLKGFAQTLKDCGVGEDDVFACRLALCELMTNVIIHGGETARFTGELERGQMNLTVSAISLNGVNITPELPDAFAESGRGMYIVRMLSAGGIIRTDGGLTVIIKFAE